MKKTMEWLVPIAVGVIGFAVIWQWTDQQRRHQRRVRAGHHPGFDAFIGRG